MNTTTARSIGRLVAIMGFAAGDLRRVAPYADGDAAAQIIELSERLSIAYTEHHASEKPFPVSGGILAGHAALIVSDISRLLRSHRELRPNVVRALTFAAGDIAEARDAYHRTLEIAA